VTPVIEKVTLQTDALFDFDKAVIRTDARDKLDDLTAKMKGINLEVVIAVGHADRLGSDAYNLKLSARRAEAVKNYLVSKGIPANRVYTEGKGERQPVKNCTERNRAALIACLQPNRRVEVEVVGTRQK
jgi:OmpA-OmpF porin, OOP family